MIWKKKSIISELSCCLSRETKKCYQSHAELELAQYYLCFLWYMVCVQ